MPVFLDPDKINDLPPDEIVRRAADPEHQIRPGGGHMDYVRNLDLLKLFDGGRGFRKATTLSASDIAKRWELLPQGGYSWRFEVMRLGELINWGVARGLVRQLDDPNGRWKLLVREQQFELCGPVRKSVCLRVRGLTGLDAIAADRIWRRELKRRERARVKHAARIVDMVNSDIDFISRHAPSTKLPDMLARFAVGGSDTIVAVRELIVDALIPLSEADANAIGMAMREVRLSISRAIRDRRRREEEDLVALSDVFTQG